MKSKNIRKNEKNGIILKKDSFMRKVITDFLKKYCPPGGK